MLFHDISLLVMTMFEVKPALTAVRPLLVNKYRRSRGARGRQHVISADVVDEADGHIFEGPRFSAEEAVIHRLFDEQVLQSDLGLSRTEMRACSFLEPTDDRSTVAVLGS